MRAVVFGCAGPRLSDAERRFFAAAAPFGFILFARNIERPDQVRRLVAALRDAVGRADAPVLIDQEGGRVQRLRPPHWPQRPSAVVFGRLAARDPAAATEAVRLNARLIAADLQPLGISVDCAPCMDVAQPGTHSVIGDRAYSGDPQLVARLGRACAEGLLAGGVLPVMKHMPGHGRTRVDSHLALPVVDEPESVLAACDYLPFAAAADLPVGMTAHLLFRCLDAARPASTSPIVVGEVIRGRLGFDGLLFSDDIGMQALAGEPAERAAAVLAAGTDVALHCNGVMAEMESVAAVVGPLQGAGLRRADAALARLAPPQPFDARAATERLAGLLAGA